MDMGETTVEDADVITHDPCTCRPKIESAVFCPYCGGDIYDDNHERLPDIPEVRCPATTMSTPRFCVGCGMEVDEYDWD